MTLLKQVLDVLERGEVLCEVTAANMLREAIEQGMVVQQWQTMDSAPKDGKRVLLRGYGTTQVAGFGRVMGCDFDAWVIANDMYLPVEFAEVWQPLPPAPKESL